MNMKQDFDFSLDRAAWVNEQSVLVSEVDLHIERIKMRGYTVLENVYDETELEYIRTGIDRVYQTQVEEVGGEQVLYDIGDADMARQLLAYDDRFLNYVTNKAVLDIVRHFLGEYFVLYQQNANLHQPNIGHTTVPWHRDLTFWHYTSSRPLSITALHIIDDYTEESGELFVLEGSQHHEELPSFEYIDENKKALSVPAGSIVMFDAMMFHRPDVNRSKVVKRSMNCFYTLHLLMQQVSLPRMLKGKWRDDPFLGWLLGYNSMQQASAKDWRLEKYQNKRKELKVFENE